MGIDANAIGAIEQVAEEVRSGECFLFLGAGAHAPPPHESPFEYPETGGRSRPQPSASGS